MKSILNRHLQRVEQKIYLRSDLARLFIKWSYLLDFLIRDNTAFIEDNFLRRDIVNDQIVGEFSYAENIS
jgi:hypothetical protein